MFNKEKTSANQKQFPTTATLISTGTILKGDVKSDNDLRIDGTIHGNVSSSAKIIIGPSGFVEGNINGNQADITGKVTGHVIVKELLQLRESSNVQGNISAAKLQIDPNAVFNGQCQMGAAPVASAMNVMKMVEPDVKSKANG